MRETKSEYLELEIMLISGVPKFNGSITPQRYASNYVQNVTKIIIMTITVSYDRFPIIPT